MDRKVSVSLKLLQQAINNEAESPRLDGNYGCIGCGSWMPKGHHEAHVHEEGCAEELEAQKRHWRNQLVELISKTDGFDEIAEREQFESKFEPPLGVYFDSQWGYMLDGEQHPHQTLWEVWKGRAEL